MVMVGNDTQVDERGSPRAVEVVELSPFTTI